jgi:hypothetical protein
VGLGVLLWCLACWQRFLFWSNRASAWQRCRPCPAGMTPLHAFHVAREPDDGIDQVDRHRRVRARIVRSVRGPCRRPLHAQPASTRIQPAMSCTPGSDTVAPKVPGTADQPVLAECPQRAPQPSDAGDESVLGTAPDQRAFRLQVQVQGRSPHRRWPAPPAGSARGVRRRGNSRRRSCRGLRCPTAGRRTSRWRC